MTVTETKAGAMSKAEGIKTPEAEDKTPVKEKVSSEEERIYTQSQADALVHASTSDWGRKLKEIETERDNLKSQIKTKENELEDIQAEREHLQKELEDLTSDDPKKYDLIKKDRTLREQERGLRSKLQDFDNKEKAFAEREKKVTSFEREVLIESIADEYEDGDASRLKKAVSGFESPTEEQIRTIADIIWSKKAEGEKPKTVKPYSGKSEGGSGYIKQSEIDDYWAEGRGEEVLKAQKEGRLRLNE